MHLTIKNFKCHKSLTLDITDHETTIIAGDSGRGKTTIIDALLWCLYGSLSMIRGCKDNCTVTLTMNDNFTIERTRRPKRLTVKNGTNTYTDAYAQHIIDDLFGPESIFTCTSVIEQGSLNAFFDMKPGDKFKLITDMVFEDDGNQNIEEKIAVKLNQVKSSYSSVESQYNTLLSSYDRFVKGINFRSLDVQTVDDLREYNAVPQQVPSVRSQLTELNRQLETAIRTETAYANQMRQIDDVKRQLDVLEKTELPLQPSTDKIDVTPLMRQLATLDHELRESKRSQDLRAIRGVNEVLDALESVHGHVDAILTVPATIITEEEMRRYDELTHLLASHPGASLSSQLRSVNRSVGALKKMKSEMSEKLNELTRENDNLQSELRSISGAVKCPHCQGHVIIKGTVLHPLSDVKDGREQEIRQRIRDITSEVSSIHSTLDNVTRALNLSSNLSDDDVPSSILSDYDAIKNEHAKFRVRDVEMQKMCKLPYEVMRVIAKHNNRTVIDAVRTLRSINVREVSLIDADITSVNSQLNHAKKINEEWTSYLSVHDRHQSKVDMLRGQLKKLMILKKPEEGLVQRLRDLIAEETQRISDAEKIQRVNDIILRTHAEKKRLLSEEAQIYQVQDYGTKLYNDLVMLEKLKVKVKDIIATAVDTRLNEISVLINHYLSQMFSVPITVDMKSHREVASTGAKKNEITFSIIIDGRETDVKSLSGGEKSRLSMAFTLALNSLSCATYKLLIMDESLSGLDESNRETCIDIIEERCKTTGITSISILHGCDEGAFDNIIKI